MSKWEIIDYNNDIVQVENHVCTICGEKAIYIWYVHFNFADLDMALKACSLEHQKGVEEKYGDIE